MARVAGFENLEVFLAKTARGVLVKVKQDLGTLGSAIGKELVEATPVDTGRARANWQATLNVPASAPVEAFDRSGQTTIQRIAATASRMTVDNSFHLANRVPYIGLLDQGHSPQADPGFIRAAVARGAARGLATIKARRAALLKLGE